MPKLNLLKIGLSLMFIIFGLCFSGTSMAGDCENCGVTQNVTGEFIYPPGWRCTGDTGIEYNTENSAETVNRNSSATVLVIGNNAPFTWTISGTGFWLDAAHTQTTIATASNSVVIYADSTACGAGTITVTGCDGLAATGYIRCTTGSWISQGGGAWQGCGSLGREVYCGAYTFQHSAVHRTRWNPAYSNYGDWAYQGTYDANPFTCQHGRVFPPHCDLAAQAGCGSCSGVVRYFCGAWATECWGCQ